MSKDYTFNPGDFVVYPANGVGQVTDRKKMTIGEQTIDCICIHFNKSDMTMQIPAQKALDSGLRQVATPVMMEAAERVLCKKIKPKRIPWNKRNAEYTAKIGTGEPVALAEVIREVYKDPAISNQTNSEKEVYEKARDRLAAEYAAIYKMPEADACCKIEELLKGEVSAK